MFEIEMLLSKLTVAKVKKCFVRHRLCRKISLFSQALSKLRLIFKEWRFLDLLFFFGIASQT
jgi:hypothetical protein